MVCWTNSKVGSPFTSSTQPFRGLKQRMFLLEPSTYEGWVLDHLRVVSYDSFDTSDLVDQFLRSCFLKPLWKSFIRSIKFLYRNRTLNPKQNSKSFKYPWYHVTLVINIKNYNFIVKNKLTGPDLQKWVIINWSDVIVMIRNFRHPLEK